MLDPKYGNYPDYFNLRGNAYRDVGDYDRASTDYSRAIKINAEFAIAYKNRGDTHYYQGEYDEAILDYQAAIAIGLDMVTGLDSLGRAYFAKHDFDRAIEQYSKAIELQPTNAGLLSARGQAELYSGRFAVAIKDFTAAVEARPSYGYGAIWLQMTRTRIGSVDLAELEANMRKVEIFLWPWPILALFVGDMAPQDLRPTALSTGDIRDRADRACEADFYLGFYRALKGERDEAWKLFESVVNACPRHKIEHQLGRLELGRLR
jgi:lipoprotein NlpI